MTPSRKKKHVGSPINRISARKAAAHQRSRLGSPPAAQQPAHRHHTSQQSQSLNPSKHHAASSPTSSVIIARPWRNDARITQIAITRIGNSYRLRATPRQKMKPTSSHTNADRTGLPATSTQPRTARQSPQTSAKMPKVNTIRYDKKAIY